MKQAFRLPLLVVALLFGCLLFDGETTANDTPSRKIPLEGESNFRDLGGYKTAAGKTVKWRQIFRTGELGSLTDADVEKLEELGLKTVVNFLLPEEIEKDGEDRLPEDVELILDPITGERSAELSMAAHKAISTANFEALPVEINPEIHGVLMDEAKEQYARLLRTLADPEKHPVAFHCSGGIHRTGTATAILLSALGVPWETVREDYLFTNVTNKKKNEQDLARLRAMAAKSNNIAPEEVDMTNVEAFYILEVAYIDGARKIAEKEYGSMDAYIREGLGITEEEIARLRAALLE